MAMVKSLRFDRTRVVLTHAFLIGGAFCMVYPLLWMLGSSFKPDSEIFANLNPIPRSFDLTNYFARLDAGHRDELLHVLPELAPRVPGRDHRQPDVVFTGCLRLCAHPLPLSPHVVRHHAGNADAAVPRHGRSPIHHLQQARLDQHASCR